MIKTIRADSGLTTEEISKMIHACEEFDTIVFEGVFRFDSPQRRFFVLGREAVQSTIMITKPNLHLDFSNAKLFIQMKELTCKAAFLHLFPSAGNTRITGLDLQISYSGDDSKFALYGLYNCARSVSVENCRIELLSNAQIHAACLYNYGGLDTHLNTQADDLSVVNSRFLVNVQPEKFACDCEACGIINDFANSIQVIGCFIEIKMKGICERHRAVGIYNRGRFCRFSSNNVKANGSHNKGCSLEEASACGMIDEGLYTLLSNCNLVGEWGGSCIGLYLKGEFTKASGNKILSTHTIKGTTVKIEGKKIVLSGNILTSTSRNARILSSCGDILTIDGNIMEVLMDPNECVSGVGAYFENGHDIIFSVTSCVR